MQLLAENGKGLSNTANGTKMIITCQQKLGENVNICTKKRFLVGFWARMSPKI
jgi:hypothetical protein